MSARVLELTPADEKHKESVKELLEWAANYIGQHEPDKIMIIFPDGSYGTPEMMLSGMTEIEILGTLGYINGLVTTGHMNVMDEIPSEEDE